MLLLTTTGRVSGRPHTIPLLYLTDGGDQIVIASWGGRPDHPEWYKNLMADPKAEIQVLGAASPVTATTMGADERATWWPRIVDAYEGYAAYQSRTEREIPIVRLSDR
jgi:deazaflavin-dependent oxidoreductase (nitroreductase family)